MIVRSATLEDAVALCDLRNYYVAKSNATFDESPLTVEAIQDWISKFAIAGPYRLLLAEESSRILGFASTQQYRAHAAFRRTVESSVYVAPETGNQGIGSFLYQSLFAQIQGGDIHSVVVGIALPNEASVRLHKKFGFTEVGVFDEYAVKHDQFISSVWMQRHL